MWHGIIVINKERGLTSHQVVAQLRRILKQAQAGHTGTLDPEATGVLVVGLGQATRSFSFLDENIKVYRAEIILGQSTDTQDATGRIVQENPDISVGLTDLQKAIHELTGTVRQIPPMFSAIKVQGRKLYDLARQGLEVERLPRSINITGWKLINPRTSYGFRDSVFAEITCSKGTYIRTLIHDLGIKLGTGAHMGGLVRLRSGQFTLEESITLAQAQEYLNNGTLDQHIIPLSLALAHLINLQLDEIDLKKAIHGGKISFQKYGCQARPGTLANVLDQALQVVAVARLEDTGQYLYWQPIKVFNYLENI
jgi:tRNA pseudouridine55 synthase